ncbi:MAG: TIGR02253 family HAD-type hydrolase [Candidatus Anstonellales archaeon]
MPDIKRVRAILFDIDDTLFASTDFSKKARRAAIRAMVRAGLPTTEKKAQELLNQIISKVGSNSQNHFDLLCKKLNAKDKSKIVASGIRAYHDSKRNLKPYRGVKQLLSQLRKAGYILCIATEGIPKKQWDKLIRLSLQDSFDHVFISQELGINKSPLFYKRICKILGFRPENCLMVGDSPVADILYSNMAGLISVRILKGKNKNKHCKSDFEIKEITDLLKLL